MNFNSDGKSVLLIGDGLLADDGVLVALGSLGLDVRFARSGFEGLGEMLREQPAIVLIDCSIDDMHYFELCRQIKLSEKHSSVPLFCVFSGEPSYSEILNAYRCGADDCFSNGNSTTQIIAKIEWLMVQKRSNASLRQYYSELKCRQSQTLDIVRATADLMDSIDAEYRCKPDEFVGEMFEERLEMGIGMIRSLTSILTQQIDCFDISALIEQTDAPNTLKDESSRCLDISSMELAQ